MRRHLLRTLAVTGVCTLSLTAHAGAATSWVDSGPVSATADAGITSKVAVAPDGSVAVAWSGTFSGTAKVYVRTRDADGVWADEVELATGSSSISALASSGGGDFTVLWAAGGSLSASTLLHGESEWSAPASLGSGGWATSLQPGPDGSLVAAWMNASLAEDTIFVSRDLEAGSTSWSPVETIVEEPYISIADLAVDAATGQRVAVWSSMHVIEPEFLMWDYWAVSTADYDHDAGTWSSPNQIDTEMDWAEKLEAAIDGEGNAVVLYGGWEQNTGLQPVRTSYKPHHSDWGSPEAAGPSVSEWGELYDLTTADGHFVALWGDINSELALALAPTQTGEWDATHQIASSASWTAKLISGPDGQLAVASVDGSPTNRLELRVLSDEGVPGEASIAATSPLNGTSSGALGTDHTPVLAYTSPAKQLRLAVGDVVAPSLGDVTIPSSAETGESLVFSVNPFDLWSPSFTTAWMFGDGAGASGESVEHTYTEPGVHTVTVTATDSAGNARSSEHAVTVTAAPEPPVTTTETTPPTTTLDTTPTQPPVATTVAEPPPPVPTTPTSPPAVVLPVTPTLEAKIVSKSIKIAATVKLAKGAKCTGTAKATTKVSGRSYKATLKLKKSGKTCHANGTIKLKKAPAKTAKVKVTVSGKKVKKRTLTAKKG